MIPEPTSILAFRNGSIGNTLAAVPALRALRKRYPQAELSVVVDPVGFQLLEHCPWINHLVVYDKRGRHRSLLAQAALVRDLRKLKPSHAILFKRFFRNGLLAFLSGAAVRAGFRTDGKAPFLTETIPYDETINIVDLNLRLAALLDAPAEDRSLELHLTDEDRKKADEYLRERPRSGTPYVIAYYGGRTVAPDFIGISAFIELVRTVAEDEDSVILIGAGPSETALAREIAGALRHAIVATDLPLRVSAALIERAALFVGLSSGPSHMAAAVNTPALVVLRPDAPTYSEETKWLPVGDNVIPLPVPKEADADTWASQPAVARARELLVSRATAAEA